MPGAIRLDLLCTYDPARNGNAPDGAQGQGDDPLGQRRACGADEVRLYDRLFNCENPDDAPAGADFVNNLNP